MIPDVLKRKKRNRNQKEPGTGFSQHRCGSDGDVLSTRSLGGVACTRNALMDTRVGDPDDCAGTHTLLKPCPVCYWLMFKQQLRFQDNLPRNPTECQSYLSHLLAGFEGDGSNTLTSFSAQVSTWSRKTPPAWKASPHVCCMRLPSPMRQGDSVPWQRLEVQSLHVKMLIEWLSLRAECQRLGRTNVGYWPEKRSHSA